MSAEIETMMYSGDTPWHGQGVYVGDKDVDSKTAIIKAGLDWEVDRRDLLTRRVSEELGADNQLIAVPSHKAIVRATDQSVLGVVGKKYKPVQNHEAFEFMDALVEDGDLRYHTAGSLRSGKRVWMLAQFGRTEVLPDDAVDKFLFLWNTHDGSGALRCLFTNVRVVCANTARMALESGTREGIYLRHTSNIKDRLEKARRVLGFAQKESEKFDQFADALTKLKLTNDMWKEYVHHLVPEPVGKDGEEPGKAAMTRADNQRSKITELFVMGRGQDIPNVMKTGWAAYSATTEYVNYFKTSRGRDAQERRFESSLFGPGAQLIANGTDKLIEFLKTG